jgi:2',3'-cyclic-nucleotide 2'-phosphodiesterase (5'-nucleotidase family)
MKCHFLLLSAFIMLCHNLAIAQPTADDKQIDITLLQLNDVYEIAPLDNGLSGGMARVTTVRKKLVKENANTYTVLSGDFLFPSALGTIMYQGKAIKGEQMVETMNATGINLVTFGNHEFDLKENELLARINESAFDWVAGNVWHHTSSGNIPFVKLDHFSEEPIPHSRILVFSDGDGTTARIGVFGLTINTTLQDYVSYDDYNTSAGKAIAELRGHCDFIIAVTHLSIEDDKKLAAQFPEIKLVLGGHEHVHSYDTIGTTIIAKADANDKTVYIHRLHYNSTSKTVDIKSQLLTIDQTIPEDPATKQVVDKWNSIADRSLRDQGFDPDEVLATLNEPYDGRESTIRYTSTNLTRMIAKAFSAATPGTNCSIYNSGSIRLDDELSGVITQYDVIRTLPYGGQIVLAEMKGSLLDSLLNVGIKYPGNGCFLQYDRISKNKKGGWLVNGKKIKKDNVYRIAINDYLVSGKQQYMEFLKQGNAGLTSLKYPEASDKLRYDLRQAVINYLRNGGR